MISPSDPAAVADAILRIARARPATLGAGRLICIDGPAGAGKTTLARRLAECTGGAVVHMDDLYGGWTGLAALTVQLPTILDPLAAGSAGTYRRYDWTLGRYAETVTVHPGPWLILEGVGSASRAHATLATVQVFIDAPPGERLERGLARDGEAALPHWKRWMVDEADLFERERPADRADMLVDGTGRTPPVVRGDIA